MADFAPSGSPAELSWGEALINLFFPPRCLACRQHLGFLWSGFALCENCGEKVEPAGCICPYCHDINRQEASCSCNRKVSRGLHYVFGLAWHDGIWRKILHQFKYHNFPQLSRSLGRLLGSRILAISRWPLPDMVTSVPLHPARLRERGYDQAALLARHTAQTMKVPYRPMLRRVRNTVSQTSLSYNERFGNVKDVFSLISSPDQKILAGKKILLVDDIYTTGATLKEVARELARDGASGVWGAVAGIQPRK